jgi:hypothetical protein
MLRQRQSEATERHKGDCMTEWRALTDDEIVELATRLRVLDWSWRPDDAAGRAQAHDAFARMVAALTGALGEPTARIPGEVPEIRWAGAETTLVLRDPSVVVELSLMANSWLADYDKVIDLEEQGLL